jgi:hypothetical protein
MLEQFDVAGIDRLIILLPLDPKARTHCFPTHASRTGSSAVAGLSKRSSGSLALNCDRPTIGDQPPLQAGDSLVFGLARHASFKMGLAPQRFLATEQSLHIRDQFIPGFNAIHSGLAFSRRIALRAKV